MISLLRLCHLALAFLLACTVYAQQEGTPTQIEATKPISDDAREILLTFTDRGLTRTTNAGPGRYYRRSGNYQSTTWSRSIAEDLAHDYPLNTVLQWPIRSLGVHCVVYRVEDALSVDAVIEQLRGDQRVKSVQRMNTFHAMVKDDPYKPLQKSFSEMQIESVHHIATGAGIRIAIIDTGVDIRHPDLAGQVTEKIDLTDSTLEFEDDIHGTAVAGIIAALSGNGLGIEGVAPNARLVALRACWPQQAGAIAAVCNSLTLARAIDTAILLKAGILNLSLTGPADPLIAELLNVALDSGIVIVAAEPDDPSRPGLVSAIDGIIRVRSASAREVWYPNGNQAAAIPAPGNDVLTTFPRGTYNFASGSSFATANVSGMIALLLELQPGLSSREIEKLLLSAANEDRPKQSAAAATGINVCRVAARLRPDIVCEDRATVIRPNTNSRG